MDAVLASDELAMVSLWGQMPYEKIIQNYQYPNNHIFLTLILSFLLKSFGLQEWVLRIPTLICGILSVCLAFQAGKSIGRAPLVGWMAAFFLALSEWHIFFSTNARGYLVIMLLAQICFAKLLSQLQEIKKPNKKELQSLNAIFGILGWLLIWIIGGWTVPTFIFYEISLVIFLTGTILFLWKVKQTSPFVFLVPLISLLIGLAAFYLQYYVWISPEMLEAATSNAAQTTLNSFFQEVMVQWLAPFESISLLLLLFAFAGGWILWKQSPLQILLILSILLGPILAGVFGFQLEIIPGMPHARTYFYLQPFFILLVAVGAFETGKLVYEILSKRLGDIRGRQFSGLVAGMIVLTLISISTQNTYQNIFLQRLKREPLNKLLSFAQSLKSNDLLIVPDDLHVEFYLYGAGEMRNRVENILREGEINKLYFLEYNKNNTSSFIVNKDSNYIKITGFPSLINDKVDRHPKLPQHALKGIDGFGPFGVYQVKQEWLKKRTTWSGELEAVGVIGEKFFKWDNSSLGKDAQHKIKFVDTFLVAVKKKQLNAPNTLMLNLMSVSGSDMEFSAEILEGQMQNKQIKYNPAWRINGWTLDHPYGTGIFNRVWNPSISLSLGSSTVSVLDVHFFKKRKAGIIKDFLSYEISMPDNILNLKVDKT